MSRFSSSHGSSVGGGGRSGAKARAFSNLEKKEKPAPKGLLAAIKRKLRGK